MFVLATGAGVEIAARAGLAVVLGGPATTRRGERGAAAALERYRAGFRPSRWWERPHVVLAADVAVAPTAGAARALALPQARAVAHSRTRGEFPPLAPVTEAELARLPARERDLVEEHLATAVTGTPAEVGRRLARLLEDTGADELMVTGGAADPEAQERSDRLLAELAGAPA